MPKEKKIVKAKKKKIYLSEDKEKDKELKLPNSYLFPYQEALIRNIEKLKDNPNESFSFKEEFLNRPVSSLPSLTPLTPSPFFSSPSEEAIYNSDKFVLKFRISLSHYRNLKDKSDLLDYLKLKGMRFKDSNKSNQPYGTIKEHKDFESGAIIYRQYFSKKDLEDIGREYLLMSCE